MFCALSMKEVKASILSQASHFRPLAWHTSSIEPGAWLCLVAPTAFTSSHGKQALLYIAWNVHDISPVPDLLGAYPRCGTMRITSSQNNEG